MQGIFNDLTGQKLNYWTIIKKSNKKSKGQTGAFWLCKCICGVYKILSANHLIHTKVKSCGCQTKKLISESSKRKWENKRKKYGENYALVNAKYNDYQRGAKLRKLKFNISKEYFSKLIFQNCFYCGSSPNNIEKSNYLNMKYNGIDRIDNKKGYEKKNIVPCCKKCNRSKTNLSLNDWFTHLKLIMNTSWFIEKLGGKR